MTRTLQAIYEKGILRPLEPLPLREHQQVTLTLSDQAGDAMLDSAFLRDFEADADDSVTIEDVRHALAGIPGSMSEDFRRERDERF